MGDPGFWERELKFTNMVLFAFLLILHEKSNIDSTGIQANPISLSESATIKHGNNACLSAKFSNVLC